MLEITHACIVKYMYVWFTEYALFTEQYLSSVFVLMNGGKRGDNESNPAIKILYLTYLIITYIKVSLP